MLMKFKPILVVAGLSVLSGCGGGTEEAAVTPTQSNRAPVISGAPNSVMETESLRFTPTAADADGDVLQFSIRNKPSWLNFDTTTGTLTGTAEHGHAGSYHDIQITVSDGKLSATHTFSIHVTAAPKPNTAPELSGSAPSATELQSFVFAPIARDADGDLLLFSIENKPTWVNFDSKTGTLSGTPQRGDAGHYDTIILTVSDGRAKTSLPVRIMVNAAPAPNRAPVLSFTSQLFQTIETQPLSIHINASDPDGDALQFSLNNHPSWLTIDASSGRISGTPERGDAGRYDNIELRVNDGSLTASMRFALQIDAAPPLNTAPVISGTANAVMEAQSFSFTPMTRDAEQDLLQFSVENKPAWLQFDSKNGTLRGTPALGDAGDYSNILIRVSDGSLSSQLSLTIRVDAAQRIVLSLPSAVTTASYVHSFADQMATIMQQGNVEIDVIKLPTWLSFKADDFTLTGVPQQVGRDTMTLLAKNNQQTWVVSGELESKDKQAYLATSLLDFYSKDFDGALRQLRNDVSGGIAAEVQFVQSHSVAPNTNFKRNATDESKSRYMPSLVAQRDALLLFMPHETEGIRAVRADLYQHDVLVDSLTLQHPNLLPAADLDNGTSVTYSSKAWSAVLPWQQVKNGLSLQFVTTHADGEQKSILAASAIDIKPASQLVLKSLRLGMLTTPDQTDGHYTLRDPISAATDYFQTIPTSRLVVASYADMTLDKVIISDGTIYDKARDSSSSVEGGVYSGDMREAVAKAQVSTGINLADVGYSSNNMRQSYPHVIKQITNHHAWGQYINGRIAHGLSGGNGIGTLISSSGNEASHEWGHAYGLGHYPGQELTTDGRWAVHHADSGWGYIAHRQRLRSNIAAITPPAQFTFHKDAMSGGESNSAFSKYTHHTGYSARIIQDNIASFPIADTAFATGYKMWNSQTGRYEAFRDQTPRPVPLKVGTAVATILGGYDPVSYKALIYPVFHGNYGNIFPHEAPDLSSAVDQCWVDVRNAEQALIQVKLAATRHHAGSINQLHFNIDAQFKPTEAILYCRHKGIQTELTRQSFDGVIPALPEVAIVGQEHGFSQFKQRELAHMEQALQALAPTALLLSHDLAAKVASYTANELSSALSESAMAKLSQIQGYQAAAESTKVLLNHARAEQLPDANSRTRLAQHLQNTGLHNSSSITLRGTEVFGNGVFWSASPTDGSVVQLTARSNVPNASRSQWLQDAAGRIHPVAAPELCLSQAGNNIVLQSCVVGKTNQYWQSHNGNSLVFKNTGTGKCLDFDRSNVKLIPYGCHGGGNQQWTGISTEPALWLALLGETELSAVVRLLGAN